MPCFHSCIRYNWFFGKTILYKTCQKKFFCLSFLMQNRWQFDVNFVLIIVNEYVKLWLNCSVFLSGLQQKARRCLWNSRTATCVLNTLTFYKRIVQCSEWTKGLVVLFCVLYIFLSKKSSLSVWLKNWNLILLLTACCWYCCKYSCLMCKTL